MSKKKWEMKQHSGSSAGVGKALGIGLGAGVVLTVALAAVFRCFDGQAIAAGKRDRDTGYGNFSHICGHWGLVLC